MAVHDLWLGGERTSNPQYGMFPAKDTVRLLDTAQHKLANLYEINRVLNFGPDALAGTSYPADASLSQYFCTNVLTAGDDIRVIRLEPGHSLMAVGFLVETPEPGITFDLRLDSTGAVIAGATGQLGSVGYPAGAEKFNLADSCGTTFPAQAGCNPTDVGAGTPPTYTNFQRFWLTTPLNIRTRDFVNFRLLTGVTGGAPISKFNISVHACVWGFNKARKL